MTNPSSTMNLTAVGRGIAAWVVMLLVSVANGAVRELTYGKLMTELVAHQFSTLIGVVLLGGVIRTFVHRFPPASGRQALGLGLLWMGMTVAFEFLFFHFVGGHSWTTLLANYNILKGRVWIIVVLWIAVAPAIFFRGRGPS